MNKKILKIISFIVLVTFSVQTVAWAAPDLFRVQSDGVTDTLAPELYLQKHGVEIKSAMFLADIAQKALSGGIRSERLAEFIRSAPALTPEIAEKIDIHNATISGDTLIISYAGIRGPCVLSFCAVPENHALSSSQRRGTVRIGDVLVSVNFPSGRSDDATTYGEDVTGAAEGGEVNHEAKKIFRRNWMGKTFLNKSFSRWAGKWVLVDVKGVNDVIRMFWSDKGPSRGCEPVPDKPEILSAMFSLRGGEKAARSILTNEYSIFVYDTRSRFFTGNITTHYGIRTGSIHITRKEYDRLLNMGMEHLAARIAHEVTEIDLWREKTLELIADGQIDDTGKVTASYRAGWPTGIREWIRNNCNKRGDGRAQELNREFHRAGLITEASMIVDHMCKQSHRSTSAEKYSRTLRELTLAFLRGRYADQVEDPDPEKIIPESVDKRLFSEILSGLVHMGSLRSRKIFINMLYARVSFDYAIHLDGDIIRVIESDIPESDKSKNIMDRLEIIDRSFRKLDTLDKFTRTDVEEWLGDIEGHIRYFAPKRQSVLSGFIYHLRELLAEKNSSRIPDPGYIRDVRDIVGSSDETRGMDMSGARFGEMPDKVLGHLASPSLALHILDQSGTVTNVSDTDAVVNVLQIYSNWNYRDLKGRASTGTSTGASRSSSKRMMAGTRRSVTGYERPVRHTRYDHISRFRDDKQLRERIDNARRAARQIITDPSQIGVTGRANQFRIFFGSPTGYFEVRDSDDEYSHSLELTLLVNGDYPLNQEIFAADAIPAVAEEFEDIQGVVVNVVGVENLKRSFTSILGGGSPGEIESRASLQRLFIQLYRRDIQVAGGNLVSESSEFDSAFAQFEKAYIAELARKLEYISERRGEYEKRKNQIGLTELTDAQKDRMETLRTYLFSVDAEISSKNETLQEIRRQGISLKDERERLARLHDEIVNSREKGRTIRNSQVEFYNRDVELYNKASKELGESKGKVQAELEALHRSRESSARELQELEAREKESVSRKQSLDKNIAELEREHELTCKRIEDAQYGHPLIEGVVISNKYRVMQKLGQGGFGSVYRVKDNIRGCDRAIKIMNPLHNMTPDQREQSVAAFRREMDIMESMRQAKAQVPSIEDEGVYAGTPFFVMTLEKGLTLKEIIDRLTNGSLRMGARERIILMHGVASALSTIHSTDFIHRDIKPENIMVPARKDGSVAIPEIVDGEELLANEKYRTFVRNITILDLGSAIPGKKADGQTKAAILDDQERARITRTGMIVGTPHFMAPEQVYPSEDNKVSDRTDVYALGITFYNLLTTRLPIGEGRGVQDTLLQQASLDPDWVRDMIDQVNEKMREQRSRDVDVDEFAMESLRPGILKKLSRERKPNKRVIAVKTDGTGYRWVKPALGDEYELRARLEEFEWLEDEEIDQIVNGVFNKVPQVDGFMEALVHRMLKKEQAKRPSTGKIVIEIEKFLTMQFDRLEYRPRDEKGRGRGPIMAAAEWFQGHIKTFIFAGVLTVSLLGGGLVYVYKLYKDALVESEQAIVLRDKARAAADAAEERMRKATRAVREAEKAKADLEKERADIAKSLDLIRKDKTGVEAAKIAQEEALKEKEREIEAAKASLAAEREALRKAEEELAKYRNTVLGAFQDAKAMAEKYRADEAVDEVAARLLWWSLDKDSLGQLTLGYNELGEIMADRGALDQVLKLEANREDVLDHVMQYKAKREEKQPFFTEMVRSRLRRISILRIKGDHKKAVELAGAALKDDKFSVSKQALEIFRRSLVESLLLQAHYERDAENKKALLQKAGELAGELKEEERQHYYKGLIYAVNGDAREARAYFRRVNSYWTEKASEKDLAEGIKASRQRQAAYAVLLSAIACRNEAVISAAGGNNKAAAQAVETGLELVDRTIRSYPEQTEILAWGYFLKGELGSIIGSGDATAAYKEALRRAQNSEFKVLELLARSSLGIDTDMDDMSGTFSDMAFGGALVPFDQLRAARMLVTSQIRSHRWEFEATQRKAEAERLRAEEEKRKEEERQRLVAEREAREKENAAIRAEALRDVKTIEDARLKHEQIIKELEALRKRREKEKDWTEGQLLDKQIERADRKRMVLEEYIRIHTPKKAPEVEGSEDIEKGGERVPEEKDDKAGAVLPEEDSSGNKETGIGNDIIDAPDHRLVNSVIEEAISEGLFRKEQRGDITVIFLGKPYMDNFAELYNNLKNKHAVMISFFSACRDAGVPEEEIQDLFLHGTFRLANIQGHAGVENSSVYVMEGASRLDVLVDHEVEEKRINRKMMAENFGFDTWEDIPKGKRRPAIKAFRARPDLMRKALYAHELAEAKYPVGSAEIIQDRESAASEWLSDPDISEHYEVPIAGGEMPAPIFSLTTLMAAVSGVSAALGNMLKSVKIPSAKEAGLEARGQGIIVFADDLLETSAVFDLDRLGEIAVDRSSVLDKIVLYARDPEKGELVKSIIKDKYPGAPIEMILASEIKKHYGQDYYRTAEMESVIRISMNRSVGAFLRTDQILGVVRGPLREGEDVNEIRDKLRRSSLNVPVVAFEDAREGNIYSVLQALAKLVEIRSASDILRDGLLVMLPPLTRVTEAMQKQYTEYLYMRQALEAAA